MTSPTAIVEYAGGNDHAGDTTRRPGLAPGDTESRGRSSRHRAHATGAEVRVFVWCCGLIAAHVLIDAYVDLRPGTSPGDHPVSGSVPVAVLAALVYGFPRLRAGASAAVALVLGGATALAGVAPVALLLDGRIALGPVTGSVGALAGPVLAGLGATMLWRTRRKDGGRVRRWSRRVGWGVFGLVLLAHVSLPIGYAFNRVNSSLGYGLDEEPLGHPWELVDLETTDGLTLAAAYHPSSNGAAVIAFPGRVAAHTELLTINGYGVLVMTPRGRDRSEGDPPFVWEGEEDLRAAVRYLQSRPDVDDDRIGGIGLSHGGLLMIQAAANEPALRAIVSDGGTRRAVGDHLDLATVTFFPFTPMATLAMSVFSDSMPPEPIPDLVAEIAPKPIMFVWAGGDVDSPEAVATHYVERAGESKTIWSIPEADHVDGINIRPVEYERRVIGFFDQALLEPSF